VHAMIDRNATLYRRHRHISYATILVSCLIVSVLFDRRSLSTSLGRASDLLSTLAVNLPSQLDHVGVQHVKG